MKRLAAYLIIFFALASCSSEGTNTTIVPNFEVTQTDDATHTVKFTNLTKYVGTQPVIKEHIWNFGQGESGSFERSPEFKYLASGDYLVKLTECIEVLFCNSVEKKITVK